MTLRRAFLCVVLAPVEALLAVLIVVGAVVGVFIWLGALGLVVLHDSVKRLARHQASRNVRPGTISPGPRPSVALTGHPVGEPERVGR